jgi:hypothetical protein
MHGIHGIKTHFFLHFISVMVVPSSEARNSLFVSSSRIQVRWLHRNVQHNSVSTRKHTSTLKFCGSLLQPIGLHASTVGVRNKNASVTRALSENYNVGSSLLNKYVMHTQVVTSAVT